MPSGKESSAKKIVLKSIHALASRSWLKKRVLCPIRCSVQWGSRFGKALQWQQKIERCDFPNQVLLRKTALHTGKTVLTH
jgi:hypothetical protein